MCFSCFEEQGAHKILNQRVLEAVPIFVDALEQECEYGIGHVVFGDDNIDDESIEFCLSLPIERDGDGVETARDSVARDALLHMKTMSWKERVSAWGLANKYWTPA